MFKRFVRLIKSMLSTILGKAEDTLTVPRMEHSLREMQDNLFRFKESVSSALTYEKQCKRRYENERLRYSKLTKYAQVAARESVAANTSQKIKLEKLAKRALQLRSESTHSIEILKDSWKLAKVTAEQSKTNYLAAIEEVEKRARQLNQAKILDELNQARKEILSVREEFDIGSAAQTFDESYKTILNESERLEVMDKLILGEGNQMDHELEQFASRIEIEREFKSLLEDISESKMEKSQSTNTNKLLEEEELDSAL